MPYVLALDVGFASMGWAVADRTGRPVATGTIVTKKSDRKGSIRVADDQARRAAEMFRRLAGLAESWALSGVVAELPHGGAKSARAMASMAAGSALAAAFAEAHKLPVEWYTPGDCKVALIGRRNASKEEIEARVRAFFPEVVWPTTKAMREHAVDAAAVLVAAREGNIMRALKR